MTQKMRTGVLGIVALLGAGVIFTVNKLNVTALPANDTVQAIPLELKKTEAGKFIAVADESAFSRSDVVTIQERYRYTVKAPLDGCFFDFVCLF